VQAAQATAQMTEYLAGLAEAKRREPRDDLLSGLVNDDGPEGRMSRVDMLNTAIMLLIGGHETTVNMIANGVLTLLRNPEVIGLLQQEPEFIARVFEELLRYEPPAQVTPTRVALTDVTIGGVTIPRGAPVWVMWAAANRDPERFADPDRFDPDRENIDHLGFGSGIHSCFGAPLARLETQIALIELFRRLENPRLVVDPPPYRRNPFLRGPRHLRIAFDGVRLR
jgi:cytochrome P450